MAGSLGPRKPTNGLVYYVDFSNPNCYVSGSGYNDNVNLFNDLTKFTDGYKTGTGRLYAGAEWQSDKGGCAYFDGVNDHGIHDTVNTVINNRLGWASVTSSETPIPDTDTVPMSTELTINLWFYNTVDSTIGYLLSKPWDGSGRYNWVVREGGWLQVILYQGATPFGTDTSALQSSFLTNSVWQNRWLHLTYWISQTHIGFRFNYDEDFGSKTHTLAQTAHGAYNQRRGLVLGSVFAYGDAWGGGSQAVTGKIANLSIYNRVLTDKEMQQDFNATRGKFGV